MGNAYIYRYTYVHFHKLIIQWVRSFLMKDTTSSIEKFATDSWLMKQGPGLKFLAET